MILSVLNAQKSSTEIIDKEYLNKNKIKYSYYIPGAEPGEPATSTETKNKHKQALKYKKRNQEKEKKKKKKE